MSHNVFYMYTVFNFHMQCLCMLIYPRIYIRIISGVNKIRNCSNKLLRIFGIIIILLFLNHTVLQAAHIYMVIYICIFRFCIYLLLVSYFDISYPFECSPITMHINELFRATRFNPFYVVHI